MTPEEAVARCLLCIRNGENAGDVIYEAITTVVKEKDARIKELEAELAEEKEKASRALQGGLSRN